MRILAVIVDFAGAEDAARLAVSLRGQARQASGSGTGSGSGQMGVGHGNTGADFSLYVVHLDNGNAIPVSLTAQEIAAGVQCVRAPRNRGYAAGLNFAVEKLGQGFDAYWFLNPDLDVAPDCLGRLVSVLENHPEVGAVGPRVLLGDTDRVWGARGVISPLFGMTAMTDWPESGPLPRWSYIPGSSLLVRAKAYHQVGGLPERYRLYFEETEFCVRLQKAGLELWVNPEAVARHRVQSRAEGVPARHFAFYFARNNLYFWRENFGIPWPVQAPRMAFVVAKELLVPLRHARSREVVMDRLKYVLNGVRDSVAFLKEKVTPHERELFPDAD